MAWNQPTLGELISRVENDLSTKFFGTAAALRRSVLKVLARVWAGAVYLLHLYLSWVYDQGFAHLASEDQLGRHGQEVGVYRKAPTYAEGSVRFIGTPDSSIPQGTRVQTVDTLQEYQTTAPATVGSSGEVVVYITAMNAGKDGNQEGGVHLELVSPLLGVDNEVPLESSLSGGADLEDPELFRARILYKKRNPPQGGADADYVIWSTSVPPVTDAWTFPNYPEANSVTVRVANYTQDPPTLSAEEVADVLAYLTDRTRKPVTADVRVASVGLSRVTISAQLRPLNATTQAAAITELKDLLSGQGKTNDTPGAPGTTIARSQVQNAIAGATGVTGSALTLISQDGETVEDVVLSLNLVAILDGAIFTAWE